MKFLYSLFLLIHLSTAVAQQGYYIKSTDHIPLYIEEYGKGKPVIFLAGGPGLDAEYMDSIWHRLSSEFKCVILNQRGTGKSLLVSLDSISIQLKNYVDDIECLRKQLRLEKLVLIGHSWGGMLAMAYAATYPFQTEKLILLNSGGPDKKFLNYFTDNIHMRLCQNEGDDDWPGYFFDRERALATENWNSKDSSALKKQSAILQFIAPDYFKSESKRIERLKKYKGSVWIIQGRQDPVGESTAYQIKDILPQSKLFFIEKCGHYPWFENDAQRKEFFVLLSRSLK